MLDRISIADISLQPRISHHENGKQPIPVQEKVRGEVSENITNKEMVEEVISSMNKFLQPTHTSLKFEFHEKLNEYYVKLIDDKTQEIVREIPSKKLLDLYAAMTEFIGIIIDKKI